MPEISDDDRVMSSDLCCCFHCGARPTQREYDEIGYRYADFWVCSDECKDGLMHAFDKYLEMVYPVQEPT